MASALLHPACEALPELPPERYRELVESIRQHGLEDPIVRHEGAVLDGRHRLRACAAAGVEPRFVEWDGRGGDPVGFIALKQIRRDMTDDQRAAWAVEFVLPAEEKRARERQGTRTDLLGESAQRSEPQRARDRAAESAGVSSRKVGDAKSLKDRNEALFSEVKAGTLTLPEAGRQAAIAEQVAKLPDDERERATAVTRLLANEGVPSPLVIEQVGRLRSMPTEDRLRIYALSESNDQRKRGLALTEIAATPPMPHPALELLDQATDRLSRAGRFLQGEASAEVQRARRILRDIAQSLRQEPDA